jgi:aryl-alcohol dehydrogenase-like predicted oxidoreductase
LSLGLCHNVGDTTAFSRQRDMLRTAFHLGMTHFDLANNYGPPFGSAEENFEGHLKDDFKPYRDEMVISTLIGVSTSAQFSENADALANLAFSADELQRIDAAAGDGGPKPWRRSSEARRDASGAENNVPRHRGQVRQPAKSELS